MRLLGLDFESTGLDTGNDRIVEVGAVIWEDNKPLGMFSAFVHDETFPEMSAEVTAINGITTEMLKEFGAPPSPVYHTLSNYCVKHKVDYIVAHNGENFDKPFLFAELSRLGGEFAIKQLPWIDTRTDLPHLVEPSSRRLIHMAADLGFVNPFPHRAVFDVLTMLRILSNYGIDEVLAYQAIPFITVRGLVSYEDRQLAKDQRFSWEQLGDKKFVKMWVKRIKKNRFEAEQLNCKFPIREIEHG